MNKSNSMVEVMDKVRCNNCYNVFDEDIIECPNCKTDQYLMQPFLGAGANWCVECGMNDDDRAKNKERNFRCELCNEWTDEVEN